AYSRVLWPAVSPHSKILVLECGASEIRLSARHASDLFPLCANRQHGAPRAMNRYRSIQKNNQDGSVWLMIGKLQLKRQDKVGIAPIETA
ncbi:hypothetical protein, partial [Bradyrhizobium sp. AUGA SZCCT0042]|uniref:hypothetical protein n=1 Tax=Bradyrhizobium sp. AUGA SZCCT0042 TaxID=2807651 RepID=UPI001BA64AF7